MKLEGDMKGIIQRTVIKEDTMSLDYVSDYAVKPCSWRRS